MKTKLIKCGYFQYNLIKLLMEKRKPMNFNEMLKMALAGKNKQAHRIVGGTKQARKLQAQHSEKHTITKGQSDERIRELEREAREGIGIGIESEGPFVSERVNSKTDI